MSLAMLNDADVDAIAGCRHVGKCNGMTQGPWQLLNSSPPSLFNGSNRARIIHSNASRNNILFSLILSYQIVTVLLLTYLSKNSFWKIRSV